MMLSTPRNGYAVELVQMPQLAEAVDSQDDWTGLTDPAARRKRQNRLNVRAHRKYILSCGVSIVFKMIVHVATTFTFSCGVR